MVTVEGGTMSSPSALAGQSVVTFSIGKYEVTWDEWQSVRTYAVSHGYDLTGIGSGSAGDHPVRQLNWYDVVKWCNAKSEMEGSAPVYYSDAALTVVLKTRGRTVYADWSKAGYRLPTEVEWEWAARGGLSTHGYTYSGSDVLGAVGWYGENSVGAAVNIDSGRGTWPVGQKQANELGLYDMSGNVWEWCFDGDIIERSLRGGGWADTEPNCTAANSLSIDPTYRYLSVGFRLARTLGN